MIYTIYADGKPLFIPASDVESDATYTVTDPELKLELNAAGNLSFTMPPGNSMYKNLNKLKTVIQVYRDGVELWRGRVLETTRNFWNQKEVYCEGDLAFLNDYQMRAHKYTGTVQGYFKRILKKYNAVMDDFKQFTVGDVSVDEDETGIEFKQTDAKSAWELIKSLVDDYGGYVKTRLGSDGNRYIDWTEDAGTVSEQTIQFGSNLLDLEENISAEDVYTVIVPLGKADSSSGDRVTIKSVNDGNDYLVSSEGVKLFGHIEKTVTWDKVTSASRLKTKAEKKLAKAIQMACSLTVDAVDLHQIDVNTEVFELGMYVPCVSIPHDFNSNFLLTAMTIKLDEPGEESYTLGNSRRGLTDSVISAQRAADAVVSVTDPEEETEEGDTV